MKTKDAPTECTCKKTPCKGRFFGCGYKPVDEWLDELPDGYRERAKRNTVDGKECRRHVDNMHSALTSLKVSNLTEEGEEFWWAVQKHYNWEFDTLWNKHVTPSYEPPFPQSELPPLPKEN